MSEDTQKLDVQVVAESDASVPVKVDAAALRKQRKKKMSEQLEDLHALGAMGTKILKIKNKMLSAIGKDIERLGVKSLGYGKIASAGENAENAFVECDRLIAEMRANNPSMDPEIVVALMQLQLGFNKQIIEIGESYLKTERQVSTQPQGNTFSFPFPAGQSTVVAIGPAAPKAVEDSAPKD